MYCRRSLISLIHYDPYIIPIFWNFSSPFFLFRMVGIQYHRYEMLTIVSNSNRGYTLSIKELGFDTVSNLLGPLDLV